MIYALLWLSFVGYLLFMGRTAPEAPLAHGAVAGIGVTAAAWACLITGFDPAGPTPTLLRWATPVLLTILTGWMLFQMAGLSASRRRVTESPADATMKPYAAPLSPTVLLLVGPAVFGAAAGYLGYGSGVAITGGLVLFALGLLIGRRRRT